jgi:hypothetical protein
VSEIDQRHDPRHLLGVIAEQNQLIKQLIAEQDHLRGEVASRDARLSGFVAAFEEGGTLGILQMMAHDASLDPQVRIRAASAAVPFERPKLSVTATTTVPLFDLLEARRRKGKVIEHAPAPASVNGIDPGSPA